MNQLRNLGGGGGGHGRVSDGVQIAQNGQTVKDVKQSAQNGQLVLTTPTGAVAMDKSAFFDSEILLTMRYVRLYVLLCVKTGINFRGYNKPASMLQQLGVAIREHLCYTRMDRKRALQRDCLATERCGPSSTGAYYVL